MQRLNILIVDDEPLIRAGIRHDLASLDSVSLSAECGSVAEAVAALRSSSFDLVLLDVQLPDGTGFDVIRLLGPHAMPAVVFITAYDHYAIQAFEVNAVDYLLKPFDDLRLHAAIARAHARLAHPASLVRHLQALLDQSGLPFPQRLVVRSGDRFDFVPVSSIDWIESANNYTILHCGPHNHLHTESLSALERALDPATFLRVHRSHIVNLSRLLAVNSVAGGVFLLQLQGGARVSSGRQYAHRIRHLLKPIP